MASLYCINCSALKEAERKDSYCKSCRSAKSRENRQKAYLAKGHAPRPKNSEGRSKNCRVCNEVKEPGYENGSYCKKCDSDRKRQIREDKRSNKSVVEPVKAIRKSCASCGAVNDSPSGSYCIPCRRQREREGRVRRGVTKKNQTGLCPCGAERAPNNKSYCQPCANAQSAKWRKIHGFTPEEIARKNVLQRSRYKSKSKGRVRRKGTLINGVPVSCKECDVLQEGWCQKCDELYVKLKERYHAEDGFNIKAKTRSLTRALIKSGVLVKKPCEHCGTTKKIEAHHEDYTKPLEIWWLCKGCHDEWHTCLNRSSKLIEMIEAQKAEIESELNLTEDK